MSKSFEFDEVSSAMAFEAKIKSQDYIHGDSDLRYIHSWWREAAKWQHSQLLSAIEERDFDLNLVRETLKSQQRINDESWEKNKSALAMIEKLEAKLEHIAYMEPFDPASPNVIAEQALTELQDFRSKHGGK